MPSPPLVFPFNKGNYYYMQRFSHTGKTRKKYSSRSLFLFPTLESGECEISMTLFLLLWESGERKSSFFIVPPPFCCPMVWEEEEEGTNLFSHFLYLSPRVLSRAEEEEDSTVFETTHSFPLIIGNGVKLNIFFLVNLFSKSAAWLVPLTPSFFPHFSTRVINSYYYRHRSSNDHHIYRNNFIFCVYALLSLPWEIGGKLRFLLN